MTDKGRVVQTVVTTETTTEYEEEESMSDRVWRGLDRATTIVCLGVAILMAVTIATSPNKKRDIFVAPKPNENV